MKRPHEFSEKVMGLLVLQGKVEEELTKSIREQKLPIENPEGGGDGGK